MRSPSSVIATRRVVRCSNDTSSAFSSNAMRLLMKAGDTPSSSAAAANPARRATSTNTRRSLRIGILFMIRVLCFTVFEID
jgi:hypothetical protein